LESWYGGFCGQHCLFMIKRLTSVIELFLPSYVDYDFIDLEHKQDPVEDIILTQDELDNMLPS